MEFLSRLQFRQPRKEYVFGLLQSLQSYRRQFLSYVKRIKSLGVTDYMDEYEKRKLEIFNLLNFFQMITGIVVPVVGLFFVERIPAGAWIVAIFPAMVSFLALLMNEQQHHRLALLLYFILYPLFTGIIYFNGINLGIELTFVLYGILSVFFLQEIGYMLFSIGLSMVSYFVLAVVLKDYQYQMKSINYFYYLVNQALAIGYIFYGLYLIKRENSGYQQSMMQQKVVLTEQANQLKKQTTELEELNALNNKMFSIISHDLKAPMYALRNFFQTAQEMKLPAREIRQMLPDVIHDLNYTTGLMENLLHWAKSQLHTDTVRPQNLDMNTMITDVIHLLRMPCDTKKIQIHFNPASEVLAYADRDMVNLVIRNIITNGIKFTPQGGWIKIEAISHGRFAEIFITDSGIGMTEEHLQKINGNNFYSTTGTASETGTGLGLLVCKEFLQRNNGQLRIESEPGKGSTFSFTLPAS